MAKLVIEEMRTANDKVKVDSGAVKKAVEEVKTESLDTVRKVLEEIRKESNEIKRFTDIVKEKEAKTQAEKVITKDKEDKKFN